MAAAAVLVVMPMLKSGGVGRLKPFQAVQVDRAPAATEIVAPTEHASAAPVRSVVHAAARRRTQRVIVPSEEEAALQRLVAAMWSGQVQAPPYLTSNEAPLEIDTLPTPEPIQLSTIRIDPIYEEF